MFDVATLPRCDAIIIHVRCCLGRCYDGCFTLTSCLGRYAVYLGLMHLIRMQLAYYTYMQRHTQHVRIAPVAPASSFLPLDSVVEHNIHTKNNKKLQQQQNTARGSSTKQRALRTIPLNILIIIQVLSRLYFQLKVYTTLLTDTVLYTYCCCSVLCILLYQVYTIN